MQDTCRAILISKSGTMEICSGSGTMLLTSHESGERYPVCYAHYMIALYAGEVKVISFKGDQEIL